MIGGTLASVRGGRPGAAFVGRVDALTELALAYAGRSVAVLIGGEAGFGQSRLVREFLAGVEKATVIPGGFLAFGDGAPSVSPFTPAPAAFVPPTRVAGMAFRMP